ncbi:hypothetical protein THIOSC15_140002 [uncultured Thiomicrorhabdus sp.]
MSFGAILVLIQLIYLEAQIALQATGQTINRVLRVIILTLMSGISTRRTLATQS